MDRADSPRGALPGSRHSVAHRHPSRVASATVVGAMLHERSEATDFFAPWISGLERGEGVRAAITSLFPMLSDSVVAALNRELMARNDPDALIAVLRSQPDLVVSPAEATNARVPLLVVAGTADPLVEGARRLARAWPGARLLEIPAATHVSVLAHPRLLAEVRALVRSRSIQSGR